MRSPFWRRCIAFRPATWRHRVALPWGKNAAGECDDYAPRVPCDLPAGHPDPETLGRGARRQMLIAARIRRGEHPLGGIRLHRDAAAGRDGEGLRCGACAYLTPVRHHDGRYLKCGLPLMVGGKETYPRVSHSEASDVRRWWPACPDWEATAESVARIEEP